jgi:heme exporter protein CcmD
MIEAFKNWLLMSGYGGYIWTAYGLVVFVMIVQVLVIRWQRARIHQQLRRFLNQHNAEQSCVEREPQ